MERSASVSISAQCALRFQHKAAKEIGIKSHPIGDGGAAQAACGGGGRREAKQFYNGGLEKESIGNIGRGHSGTDWRDNRNQEPGTFG